MTNSSRFLASQAFAFGQNALDFLAGFLVMIYLLFFLLRDGEELAGRIKVSIPLRPEHLSELSGKFTAVLRATVKGTLIVAIIQGALGGLIFWILGIHAHQLGRSEELRKGVRRGRDTASGDRLNHTGIAIEHPPPSQHTSSAHGFIRARHQGSHRAISSLCTPSSFRACRRRNRCSFLW